LAWESRPIRPARICDDRTGSLASMKHSINLTSARLPNGQLESRAFHPVCFTPVPACPRPPHRCPHEVSLRVRVPGVLLEMARPWGASQIYTATGVPEPYGARSGVKRKSAHASHVPPRCVHLRPMELGARQGMYRRAMAATHERHVSVLAISDPFHIESFQ
jgi:hypothetical protein